VDRKNQAPRAEISQLSAEEVCLKKSEEIEAKNVQGRWAQQRRKSFLRTQGMGDSSISDKRPSKFRSGDSDRARGFGVKEKRKTVNAFTTRLEGRSPWEREESRENLNKKKGMKGVVSERRQRRYKKGA